ncbi:hypothetical protein Tco_0956810, partial [Tanacetum coccineum]
SSVSEVPIRCIQLMNMAYSAFGPNTEYLSIQYGVSKSGPNTEYPYFEYGVFIPGLNMAYSS